MSSGDFDIGVFLGFTAGFCIGTLLFCRDKPLKQEQTNIVKKQQNNRSNNIPKRSVGKYALKRLIETELVNMVDNDSKKEKYLEWIKKNVPPEFINIQFDRVQPYSLCGCGECYIVNGSVGVSLDNYNKVRYKCRTVRHYTLLHLMVFKKDLKSVEYLIQMGADIEARDSCNETPIFGAFQQNPKYCLYKNKLYTVKTFSKYQSSPIEYGIIECLITAGADTDAVNNKGNVFDKTVRNRMDFMLFKIDKLEKRLTKTLVNEGLNQHLCPLVIDYAGY